MAEILPPADYLEITQLLARFGHLVEDRDFAHLDELFAENAAFDEEGDLAAARGIRAIEERLSAGPDVAAHLTTNLVALVYDADRAEVVSKFLHVDTGGAISFGEQLDTLVRTAAGWRLLSRTTRTRSRRDPEDQVG